MNKWPILHSSSISGGTSVRIETETNYDTITEVGSILFSENDFENALSVESASSTDEQPEDVNIENIASILHNIQLPVAIPEEDEEEEEEMEEQEEDTGPQPMDVDNVPQNEQIGHPIPEAGPSGSNASPNQWVQLVKF